jgi:IS4 transposase
MDRGYLDFQRLYTIHQSGAFFVTRAKRGLKIQRRYSRPVDKSTGLRSDQTIFLAGINTSKDYQEPLRRISYYDTNTKKHLVFLTNNFILPALTIAALFKARWRVEIFFKWIKQHLRIKAFFGTSENAVKTQVWIAVCVYVLIAILKKRLNTTKSLYTILQVLSLSQFEKEPLQSLLSQELIDLSKNGTSPKQLTLFN